jgi:hypothetical protein
MILLKITEFYTEWLSSTFRIVVIFESFVKQNNELDQTCRYIHAHLQYQTSFVWVQRFTSFLDKTKYTF